jgi:hypothetical protein
MRTIASILAFALIATTAFETPVVGSEEVVVRKFFELRERVLDQRGSEKDVNELLRLFAKNARYEHPAFGVVMDLSQARAGMLAHLNEGRNAKIEIRQVMAGRDFAIAETTLHYSLPDKDSQLKRIDRPGAAIFQFEGEQIARVAEY